MNLNDLIAAQSGATTSTDPLLRLYEQMLYQQQTQKQLTNILMGAGNPTSTNSSLSSSPFSTSSTSSSSSSSSPPNNCQFNNAAAAVAAHQAASYMLNLTQNGNYFMNGLMSQQSVKSVKESADSSDDDTESSKKLKTSSEVNDEYEEESDKIIQSSTSPSTTNNPNEPKPTHSYIGLIALAILSSPDRKLVLSDIYQWILDNYTYFHNRGSGWRNSIRHNLSLNDCFMKAGRSANGKGHYWTIHPANLEDFVRGDFRRRRAQRRVRKSLGLTVPEEDEEDEEEDSALLLNAHQNPFHHHHHAAQPHNGLFNSTSPYGNSSRFGLFHAGGSNAPATTGPNLSFILPNLSQSVNNNSGSGDSDASSLSEFNMDESKDNKLKGNARQTAGCNNASLLPTQDMSLHYYLTSRANYASFFQNNQYYNPAMAAAAAAAAAAAMASFHSSSATNDTEPPKTSTLSTKSNVNKRSFNVDSLLDTEATASTENDEDHDVTTERNESDECSPSTNKKQKTTNKENDSNDDESSSIETTRPPKRTKTTTSGSTSSNGGSESHEHKNSPFSKLESDNQDVEKWKQTFSKIMARSYKNASSARK